MCLEHSDGAPAGSFGHIHGPIGCIGEILSPPAAVRSGGNADAGIYRDLVAHYIKWPLECGENALCDEQGIGVIIVRGGKQQSELVSAQPGHKSIPGSAFLQAIAHSDEQRIAGRVPMCVIDWLEAVEINKKNRALFQASPGLS